MATVCNKAYKHSIIDFYKCPFLWYYLGYSLMRLHTEQFFYKVLQK